MEDFLGAGERRVAWLRIAAVGLIVAAEHLPHPNPNRGTFALGAVVAGSYALAALAVAYRVRLRRELSLALTAADVVMITALAFLSGGAFSDARLAYFLVPISVAFRFGWRMTSLASLLVTAAYDLQAATNPARHQTDAAQFLAVQSGYLLWVGAAATLFSGLLAARGDRLVRLAGGRRQLLADVMTAEERSRRLLAESLHDNAIQNVLAARQDVEEAAKTGAAADLERAYAHLTDTVAALRSTIFDLHPHVLEQAGLETAIRAVAERASRSAGFEVELRLDYRGRRPVDALLLGAAREFIGNAARHADATKLTVCLETSHDQAVLVIADDGAGFDTGDLSRFVADAHIGLLSQRERIEASGGELTLRSAPGRGTRIEVRVPVVSPSA